MLCLSYSDVRLVLPRLAEGWRYLERYNYKAIIPTSSRPKENFLGPREGRSAKVETTDGRAWPV